jgi:acetyltransferase-like isoleucine patch superfamily enzyme
METYQCIAPSVKLGRDVKLSKFINLYGCEVGDETKIGAFVEIQKNATVGKRCKISSHTFVCEGVTIEDNVFVGHNVAFINDSYPRATTGDQLQVTKDVPPNSIVAGNPARVLRYIDQTSEVTK